MTSVNKNTSFSSPKKQDEKVTPDSTTQGEKQLINFIKTQDVLAKQKDGRYYFGTIIEVDPAREQCLVKYGDNTQNWSSFKDLTKLSTGLEQEDLLCVICKKSSPKHENVISVCVRCGRGYHKKCHQPEILSKNDSNWICKRCIDSDPNRLKKSDLKPPFRRDSRNSSGSQEIMPSSTTTKVLPYELNSLNWDTYHRINREQIYCYCGANGEWYKQMLQCGRCKQWFHEKCIECLQYPLFCGDRFYVFVCSICNQNKEFVGRLEIKWVDLVHLMLFNLTVHHCKKYYELDTVVIPYINDNWNGLQLPPKMNNISKIERREHILSVLSTNRNRFKCGREIKKRTTIWGLRVRLPPPAPCVVLPLPHKKVTETELKELWQGNRRLQFLSSSSYSNNGRKMLQSDAMIRNLMLGTAYQQSANHSETDSPCPSPEFAKEERVFSTPATLNASITKLPHGKEQYLGAGCAKKSAPFKKMSLQRRKKLLAMTNRERERVLKRPRRSATANAAATKRENTAKKKKNDPTTNNKLINGVEMPPTPPTSVSAPPTPPASLQSDFGNESNEGFSQLKSKNNKHSNNNLLDLEFGNNTLYDTSSDETSSKSTLDLIIPPPKDFEGKNNPFLALLRMTEEPVKKRRRNGREITLPLPLKTVIPGQPLMRPMKRQLSEKDIIVGPNGEIKRKKRSRRNNKANLNNVANYGIGQTASKTATILPAKPPPTDSNTQLGGHIDYNTLNTHSSRRRLRQRPEKPSDNKEIATCSTTTTTTTTKPPTPKPSPVKTEPDIDMDELKTSVNMYFGAVNRISAGERFAVLCKRVGPTGKIECLIEWEGPGGGSQNIT